MKEMLQRGAVGVATLLAVDVMGGCTATQAPEPELTPPTTAQLDPEQERQAMYYEGPKNPCLYDYDPTDAESKACMRVQKNTRIALVNFDFTPEEAQEAARSMKVPFDRSTNGVFNAQPVVIPASEAAKKEAAKWNAGCVDSFMDFASLTAQNEMPDELDADKIDIVIALTNAQACDPDVGGMAEGGRYADILTGGQEISPTVLGYAAAHEAGHNVGLGHVNDLWCTTQLDEQDPAAGPVNLDTYVEGCKLQEYSTFTNSVMGNPYRKDENSFGSELAQMPKIMWPEEHLNGDNGMVVEATPQGASLGAEDMQSNKFISVPIPFSPTSKGVDSLAIVPSIDDSTAPGTDYEPYVWSGTVYLHKGDNSIASLGYVGGVGPGESETRVLQYQGKTITVTLAGGRIAVASS